MSGIAVERAVTLIQPYASLMAYGDKQIETRGRLTHYRGWVAIHAAMRFPDEYARLCDTGPFRAALSAHGLTRENLPLGEVLAVVRFVDCLPAVEVLPLVAGKPEFFFGDYREGRFAILTKGLRRLARPIPMRGFQSIPWRLPHPITSRRLLKAAS